MTELWECSRSTISMVALVALEQARSWMCGMLQRKHIQSTVTLLKSTLFWECRAGWLGKIMGQLCRSDPVTFQWWRCFESAAKCRRLFVYHFSGGVSAANISLHFVTIGIMGELLQQIFPCTLLHLVTIGIIGELGGLTKIETRSIPSEIYNIRRAI